MRESRTIVIGSSREQKLPALVLEHSIRRHCKDPGIIPRIVQTHSMTFPSPKSEHNRSRTGFSFHRFAVPKLANYSGVGIYLECDQLLMADVEELLSIPFGSHTILRPSNQTSVLVLDCGRLTWDLDTILRDLDAGIFNYHSLMERLCIEPAGKIANKVPVEWNSLERYEAGVTKNLHYTNMACQPWRKWGHPLRQFWLDELNLGVKDGFIDRKTVEHEVSCGFVVPEVLKAIVS